MNDDIKLYRDYFGLDDATFSRIDHHDTMIAVVYKVDQPSKKPLILKISTREKDYFRELYCLNTLAGVLPVPKVLKTVEPTSGFSGAILMECLEGALLRESDWSHGLATEVGCKLGMLHSRRADAYGDFPLKQGGGQGFEDKFYEELQECASHLPKEAIQYCERYFKAHKYLLESVDGPCMVHRDFRPGNMIVHDGKLLGIIDWASGRFGFAEQDFCSMEHRNWPRNPEHKQSLLAGYSSVRPLPNFTEIMPLLRLGRALAVIGFTVKSSTWNGKNEEIYQYNRQFLDRFLIANESN